MIAFGVFEVLCSGPTSQSRWQRSCLSDGLDGLPGSCVVPGALVDGVTLFRVRGAYVDALEILAVGEYMKVLSIGCKRRFLANIATPES